MLVLLLLLLPAASMKFIAAMFDAQNLAKAEVAKLVSEAGSLTVHRRPQTLTFRPCKTVHHHTKRGRCSTSFLPCPGTVDARLLCFMVSACGLDSYRNCLHHRD